MLRFVSGIGGSRVGGVPGTCPPLWDPILSFSHTFSPKSTCVRGSRPPMGARPLREILDPPLSGILKRGKTNSNGCFNVLFSLLLIQNTAGISDLHKSELPWPLIKLQQNSHFTSLRSLQLSFK